MSQSPKFTYFTQEPTNKRIYDEREDEDSPFDSSPVDMECTSIQERIPQQHQLNQEQQQQQQQQQQQASRQEAASSRTVKKVKIQGTNPLQNPITADPTTPRHEIPENKKPGEKDEEWRLLLLKVYSSISSILERATHRESAHGGTSYMMDVGTLERLLVAYKTNSMVRTLVRTVPVNLWKLIVLEEKLNSYINEKEDNKTKNQAKEEKEVEKVEVKGEIKGDGVNDDIEISKTHNSATLDNPSWWEFLEVVGTKKKKMISDEMVQIIMKELEISIEQGKNEYKIESILEFIDKLDHRNNEKISEKMKEMTDKLVNTIMETSTETMSKVEGQEDYEQVMAKGINDTTNHS
ncbi:hypothetical protein AX774_g1008 [Zancudomyces culisetae]|uniref:Uncharacterized protein n=1 Tax=Zancudomyces culisetae TaxID=1213189 RepID=A0A1R1PWR6_ZANCU|nr:hypothetical protein AX774_g1008 [Zancudomyces culisetae]|eukprot:OMH85440.1 hypothetical protein AX774_g1008 [Zancudomyces culisetae]